MVTGSPGLLDLGDKSDYSKGSIGDLLYGGVTVSTGIGEAVAACRGSYRPR